MSQSITPKQALFLWHLILTDGASDVGVMASATVPTLKRAEWQALVDAGYLDSRKRGRAVFLTATNQAWSWAEQTGSVEFENFESPAGAAALEALLNRLLPLLREREIGLAELFKNDPPPAPPSAPAPRAPRKKSASKGKAKTEKTPTKKQAKAKSTEPASAKKETQAKAKSTKPASAKKKTQAKAKSTKEKPQSVTRFPSEPLTPSLSERIERACLQLTHGARQTRVKLYDVRASLGDVARKDLDSALLALQREKKLVLYREDNSAALRPEDDRAALFVGNEPRHLVLLEA